MIVKTGKSLPQLLEMLTDIVGPHHYDRWDVEFDADETAEVHSRLRNGQRPPRWRECR